MEKFGEIESVKTVSDLNSPVSGKITAVNKAVADDLEILHKSPFQEGWLIKVKLKGKAPASLLGVDQYDKLVAETA